MGLLVTIVASILSHIVGTFLPLSEKQHNRGIVGYSGKKSFFPISFLTVFFRSSILG
jgi:hypothetical protein